MPCSGTPMTSHWPRAAPWLDMPQLARGLPSSPPRRLRTLSEQPTWLMRCEILGAGEPRMLRYAYSCPGVGSAPSPLLRRSPLRSRAPPLDAHPLVPSLSLLTFDSHRRLTGHPDHVRTHRVTLLAAEAAHREVYPDAGHPWAPSAVYSATHPRSSVRRSRRSSALDEPCTPLRTSRSRIGWTCRPGWSRSWPQFLPTARKLIEAPFLGSSPVCRRRPARNFFRLSGSSVALWRAEPDAARASPGRRRQRRRLTVPTSAPRAREVTGGRRRTSRSTESTVSPQRML